MEDLVALYGREILQSDEMAQEEKYPHHGKKSCFCHSVEVAYKSVEIARRFYKKADMSSLVRGALLHDYYLYNWHEADRTHRLHGVFHAKKALKNAVRDFSLNKKERDIIRKHMFPLNLLPPLCRESWIVCLADKICAFNDMFKKSPRCGYKDKNAGKV